MFVEYVNRTQNIPQHSTKHTGYSGKTLLPHGTTLIYFFNTFWNKYQVCFAVLQKGQNYNLHYDTSDCGKTSEWKITSSIFYHKVKLVTNSRRSQYSARMCPGIKAHRGRSARRGAVGHNLWLHWSETSPGSPESLPQRASCRCSNPSHQWDEEPLKQNKKVSSLIRIFSKMFTF